jgi:putative transposase
MALVVIALTLQGFESRAFRMAGFIKEGRARTSVRTGTYVRVMSDAAPIRQGFRFALAPTTAQQVFLSSCVGASRFWFNQGLALVKNRLDARDRGEDVRVPWSYKALCSELDKEARADLAPWQREVVCGCYQAGFEALGRALEAFSNARRGGRRAGFPRFRRKGGRHTESVIFQRPRITDVRHVHFDRRIGPVRTKERMSKLVRLLERDPQARVLRSTVSRRNGRWFVSFTVERAPKRRRARRPTAVAGIDVGLRRLATVSVGIAVPNGRPLQAALRRLRRLQRRLDRQCRAANPGNFLPDGRSRRGPNHWRSSVRMDRTRRRLQALHERIANLRREQAHQLTTWLTREFGVLGVEQLMVTNMVRDRHLARQIADVGWGELLRQLAYKTAWSSGSLLVAADRFYPSSKTCYACGSVKAKLGRGETVFTCDHPGCSWSSDRDLNAALNLARIALDWAQAEGHTQCYVARTGREAAGTLSRHARGGPVGPAQEGGHSPVKREGSLLESSQAREGMAVAT